MTSSRANVSVVTPCFNNALTIERALKSVANQTLQPLEVLVVDDASSDQSREIVERFAQTTDLNVRLIALPVNGGPSRARNTGWNQASSKYIAFLDSDDVWHPQKIEIQYGFMEGDESVVISGHPFEVALTEQAFEPITHVHAQQHSPRAMLLRNEFPTSSVMVLRGLPHRFDERLRYSEDYMLWLQILYSGNKGLLIDQQLYRMFKPSYGAQGLSAQLHRMQRAEIQVYLTLLRQNSISVQDFVWFISISLLKYLRRIAVSYLRNIK